MKKYLVGLLLCPLFASAQQSATPEKFSLSFGISINNTVTTAAYSDKYSNRPNSSYVFPEGHVVGDLSIFKNPDLLLRLEAGLTYIQDKYNLIGTNGYSNYRSAYKVNQAVATVNPQLLYRFYNTVNHKFYGAVGVSLSGVNTGVHSTETSALPAATYYLSGEEYDSMSMARFGGNIKLGVVTGRLDIYFDYNKAFAADGGGTIFDYNAYNPSQTANQNIFKIGVNYRIKLPQKIVPQSNNKP